MRIRVADYLTEKLAEASGNKLFMITGGMIMFLTDAVYKLKEEKGLECYCFHHEQAASMAAEAYGRVTGKLGVTFVTAGPAALNTLTSVVGAYVDRSPSIVVSGQSKVSQAHVVEPRQFSLQGFNTIPIFEQVTKYAVLLDDVSKIKYEIEKAIYLALKQPVGPVWIECPIDIQGSYFDPDEFEGFTSKEEVVHSLFNEVDKIINILLTSNRPTIIAGAGIRQSDMVNEFLTLVNLLKIPVTTTRMGMDIIDHKDDYFVGRPGTYGDRTGNYSVQNADVLLVLGSRLSIGVIGHDYDKFAPNAKKIIIDVDPQEFKKPSILDTDVCIEANLQDIIPLLIEKVKSSSFSSDKYIKWLNLTKQWKLKYPVNIPEYKNSNEINSYHFMNKFSKKTSEHDLFAVDTGSCFHVHAQAFEVKFGQRHIITGGLSTMGYSPSSIGVAVSANKSIDQDIYCISGDGSIQMNLQEFQTIAYNKLPVKTIILNNDGYLLIRLSQKNFLDGRLIGEGKDSGGDFPSMEKVANLYGIKYMSITNTEELDSKIDELIAHKGAIICEIFTQKEQLLIPRVASKKLPDGKMVSMAYDDMFPFLPEEEYNQNIKMAQECKN